jgi:hypothetical protein
LDFGPKLVHVPQTRFYIEELPGFHRGLGLGVAACRPTLLVSVYQPVRDRRAGRIGMRSRPFRGLKPLLLRGHVFPGRFSFVNVSVGVNYP